MCTTPDLNRFEQIVFFINGAWRFSQKARASMLCHSPIQFCRLERRLEVHLPSPKRGHPHHDQFLTGWSGHVRFSLEARHVIKQSR
jgi:hypothetical protein